MLPLTRIGFLLVSFTLIFTGISPAFSAGVGINATRVIINQGQQAVSVTLRNSTEDTAYLVQSYLSNEEMQKADALPIEVLPPLFHLAPNSQHDVRIIEKSHLATQLPMDRESVFYFHARAIPNNHHKAMTVENKNQGIIKIALENVIKVFFRPKNLTSSSVQAQAGLRFKKTPKGLHVANPSPYYVTLAGLTLGKQPVSLSQQNLMLSPFSEVTYPIPSAEGTNVSWTTINDLGGYNTHETKL